MGISHNAIIFRVLDAPCTSNVVLFVIMFIMFTLFRCVHLFMYEVILLGHTTRNDVYTYVWSYYVCTKKRLVFYGTKQMCIKEYIVPLQGLYPVLTFNGGLSLYEHRAICSVSGQGFPGSSPPRELTAPDMGTSRTYKLIQNYLWDIFFSLLTVGLCSFFNIDVRKWYKDATKWL